MIRLWNRLHRQIIRIHT
uniref:Uncharacterized protein n=1 Tax=Rhizophora mucronata TaxID=61149 RepID=A0A2P2N572_RHIMU